MVTLTTAADVSFDLSGLDLNQIFYAGSYTSTPTLFSATYRSGYADRFSGTGLTYDSRGLLSGGTITGHRFTDGSGQALFTISGMQISAAAIMAAARTGSTDDDMSLFASALKGKDTLHGGEVDDVLSAFLGDDALYGHGGFDDLLGGGGSDILFGGDDGDWLYGEEGNDRLVGGTGADWLSGGAGTDTASYSDARTGVVASLLAPSANTGDAKGDGYSSIENLTGSAFADRLTGNTGANLLDGGAGADRLSGGDGNDRLYGRSGNDVLAGGKGADVFVFSSALGGTNVDTIADFSVKDDTIWLDDDVFLKAGATGTLTAAAFHASTTGRAHDASDRILYDTDGGDLFYDADGSGAGKAVLFAHLSAGLSLTASDFAVIG